MVARAQANYPQMDFRVGSATDFAFDEKFDAVFSNATLHWVKDAQAAANAIRGALRPGGRFVAEFGGSGNVRTRMGAISAGIKAAGAPAFESLSPWFYPSIAEYSAILERAGLEVTFAQLFDRPTLVEAGLRSWIELYGTQFLAAITPEKRELFLATVEDTARPLLFKEGKWVADYRRLRIVVMSVG
jgi:trans-aconitate methyltransferase